ncbi:MAG: hypothetical protein Q9P44_20600 [Anaerolineae bacterium]|nr:hypothetical protein [Anaerolineae bacterium]
MFPEKPKNSPKPQRSNSRGLLIALIALPLPITLLMNQRLPSAQFIDMLLIGMMLCCTLYLLYQGIIWLLMTIFQAWHEDNGEDNIEQS